MLRNWVVYGALLIGSALVGFLIGGGPDAIRSSPAPAVLPSPPTTTQAPTTESAPPTTSSASTRASSTSTPDAATTTTTSTTTTTAPPTTTTTLPTSTATAPALLRPREELSVAVVNGVGTPGVAGIGGRALVELGYTDPAARDASATGTTRVYFAAGFASEASRLALDVGLDESAIAPVAEIPELLGSGPDGFELILLLGADGLGPR